MTGDSDPLGRLAGYVERRIAELALEYVEVARAADFSIEALRKIRNAISVRSSTYGKLERALRWAPGSVQAILAGGEPTLSQGARSAGAASRGAEPQPRLVYSESRDARLLLGIGERMTQEQKDLWFRLGEAIMSRPADPPRGEPDDA